MYRAALASERQALSSSLIRASISSAMFTEIATETRTFSHSRSSDALSFPKFEKKNVRRSRNGFARTGTRTLTAGSSPRPSAAGAFPAVSATRVRIIVHSALAGTAASRYVPAGTGRFPNMASLLNRIVVNWLDEIDQGLSYGTTPPQIRRPRTAGLL